MTSEEKKQQTLKRTNNNSMTIHQLTQAVTSRI